MTLREAWTARVTATDYEAHMQRIGQADANAALLQDLFAAAQVPPAAPVLIAGAGTGQMFTFLPPDFLAGHPVTCTDVNPAFLEKLRERYPCQIAIDDIEDSQLTPGWGAIAVVLVLEHVDWHRAIHSLARLQPENLLLIIQRNPPHIAAAVTPGRLPPGTMQVFAAEAPPHLVPIDQLLAELAAHGLFPHHEEIRPVQDGKAMVGLALKP